MLLAGGAPVMRLARRVVSTVHDPKASPGTERGASLGIMTFRLGNYPFPLYGIAREFVHKHN
jgi:hypothetical protein